MRLNDLRSGSAAARLRRYRLSRAGRISYSQRGEDLILACLLRDEFRVPRITYLDLGAHDPVFFSNTFLFYTQGCRGIAVDPNPAFAVRWARQRPGDRFICAGVGQVDDTAEFFTLKPDTLSTFDARQAAAHIASGVATLEQQGHCPIISVGTALEHAAATDILPNLLTIDVEGQDLDVLRSIDFSSWRPLTICAETIAFSTDGSGRKLHDLISFVQACGYEVYADTHINTIFVDSDAYAGR